MKAKGGFIPGVVWEKNQYKMRAIIYIAKTYTVWLPRISGSKSYGICRHAPLLEQDSGKEIANERSLDERSGVSVGGASVQPAELHTYDKRLRGDETW